MSAVTTNASRIAIIGAGSVGSTCAYALLLRPISSQILLVDTDTARLQAESAAGSSLLSEIEGRELRGRSRSKRQFQARLHSSGPGSKAEIFGYCLRPRLDMQLLINMAKVSADRIDADAEPVTDLLVSQPLGQTIQHGFFARREEVVLLTRLVGCLK